jgi:ATP-dependent DNA ligase
MKLMAMPKSIEPMQPTMYRYAFSSREWLFEPKWDGFGAICFFDKGVIRFVSCNQRSLSERFPVLQEGTKDVKALNAILDGEIVALDPNGMPVFGGLRSRRKAHAYVVVFQAFDLLYSDGHSLAV